MCREWWKLPLRFSQAMIASALISMPLAFDAQGSPFRTELTNGKYQVGFETVERYDHTRAFRDKYDYDGNVREGQTARPIQICIWYPAQETLEYVPMVYGEYAFAVPSDASFYTVLATLQRREVGFLTTPFGGDGGMLLNTMNVTVGAMKNARRAEGSFPLVIYHPDVAGSFAENAALCEALASNGYIVATCHALGTTDIPVAVNAVDLETMIRDREFVYGFMRDYPGVNVASTGLLGTGMGGLSALLMQMRNTDIEAVAVLDGIQSYRNGAQLARTFPFYDVTRTDVPLLLTYNSAHDDLDLSVVDSLIYSPRMLLAFGGRSRIDFTQYSIAVPLLADTTGTLLEPASGFYGALCRTVVDFFDVFLRGKDLAATVFAELSNNTYQQLGELMYVSKEGQKPPPTEAQFMEMIQQNKIERAVEIYEAFKKSRPGYVFFQEAILNAAGYRLLQANELEQARMIFKINAEAYPNSANVWDSYADACIANGDTQTAILCYQRVLEVLPSDSALTPGLRETLQNNATQGLEQLQK